MRTFATERAGLTRLQALGLSLGALAAARPACLQAMTFDDATHGPGPGGSDQDAAGRLAFIPQRPGVNDIAGAVAAAERTMRTFGVSRILVMPPPTAIETEDHQEYLDGIRKRPGQVSFLGGGGWLNPMIQEAVRKDKVERAGEKRFEDRALEILKAGAIGFGELTCEHFSLGPGHPYETAPPDHPLFGLLARIAAEHDVPIDIHMEAVRRDRPTPPGLAKRSSINPPTIPANIERFQRLLADNRKTRIIWAHAGWDHTSERTAALCRELLAAHPNLYTSVKIHAADSYPPLQPLDDQGRARPEWIDLVTSFRDRFVIGSDTFHAPNGARVGGGQQPSGVRSFLDQLPADLARGVAVENPTRLFKLRSA